jgi:hypothetical protein
MIRDEVHALLDVLDTDPRLAAEAKVELAALTKRLLCQTNVESLRTLRAGVTLPEGVIITDEDAANILRDDTDELALLIEVIAKLREVFGADVKLTLSTSISPEGCRVCSPPCLVLSVETSIHATNWYSKWYSPEEPFSNWWLGDDSPGPHPCQKTRHGLLISPEFIE